MKKGFTLVELLATLVIIGLISLMSFSSLNNQIKQTNKSSYDKFISSVELAVESYITNSDDYPKLKVQNNPVCINLKEVVLKRYLGSKITNPKTNTSITESSVVVKLDENSTYTYEYQDSTLCVR